MDERKRIIRELEDKKLADTAAFKQLLEGLGETLLQRIGEEEPFPETGENTFGGILAEYRRLRREIAESYAIIRNLEKDTQKLKELEGEILAGEEEHSRLEKEFGEACTQLGKLLLAAQDSQSGSKSFDEFVNPYRQEEKFILAKIEEEEQKLRELEEREGGVLAWLGKNAQIAVTRALLTKNKSMLQRIYNSAGTQYVLTGAKEVLDGEPAGTAQAKAAELKERISLLAAHLAGLKGERRNMGDLFDTEGAPFRRIQGLEKHIVHIKGEFSAVYFRFGFLAAETMAQRTDGNVYLSSVIKEDDSVVLERAGSYQVRIAETELEIEKIRAAISIDNEKAEIEKLKRSIKNHQQKIAAANDAVSDLENQIVKSQQRIGEFEAFLTKNK